MDPHQQPHTRVRQEERRGEYEEGEMETDQKHHHQHPQQVRYGAAMPYYGSTRSAQQLPQTPEHRPIPGQPTPILPQSSAMPMGSHVSHSAPPYNPQRQQYYPQVAQQHQTSPPLSLSTSPFSSSSVHNHLPHVPYLHPRSHWIQRQEQQLADQRLSFQQPHHQHHHHPYPQSQQQLQHQSQYSQQQPQPHSPSPQQHYHRQHHQGDMHHTHSHMSPMQVHSLQWQEGMQPDRRPSWPSPEQRHQSLQTSSSSGERVGHGWAPYYECQPGQHHGQPHEQQPYHSGLNAQPAHHSQGVDLHNTSRGHSDHPHSTFTYRHEAGLQSLFVLPRLPTLPSFPPNSSLLPTSLSISTSHSSSSPSSTQRLHRARTLSSVPLSHRNPSQPTNTAFNVSAEIDSNVHRPSSMHDFRHLPEPDLLPQRKRGRAGHPTGNNSGISSSYGSEGAKSSVHHDRHLPERPAFVSPSLSSPSHSTLGYWTEEGGTHPFYIPVEQDDHFGIPYGPAQSARGLDRDSPHPQGHLHSALGPSALIHDSTPSVPTSKTHGANKRPLVFSPPDPTSLGEEDSLQKQQQRLSTEAASRREKGQERGREEQHDSNTHAHEHLAEVMLKSPTPVSKTHLLASSSRSLSSSSSQSKIYSTPMPLFRRQLMQQRTVHSSYKRRFYSNPAISSSSLSRNAVGSAVASSDSSSSAAASAVKKAVFSRGRHSGGATSFEVPGRAGSGADQESDIPINIQLGRLLIATKQHVQGLLDSFIYSGDNDNARHVDPNLERVLMELLNGMLRSHSAFGSRDNISSQEQPMSFRPTMIRSLVHLRDLLSVTPTSASPISGSVSALSARLMEGPLLGVTRPRSSPLPPSRLSTSTLYPERIGVEADSDMEGEAPSDQQGGPEPILSASPGSSPLSLLDQERAIEMYHSTVEFLALMTAFVSIVCWLMQTMLGLKVSDFETSNDEGRDYRQKPDVGMDRESHQHTSRPRGGPLMNFLNLFDDRDNVLKPIMDALTYGTDLHEQLTHDRDNELGHDPAQRVGLYAWHFHLFGADPNSPLIKGGDTITEQHLQLHHFDVLLNELYTTHVLSISVKEHQKDHGQFYTPPNIVEFMWKRTFKGFGNMLDKFLEKTNSLLASDEPQVSFSRLQFPEPLIPTVLDPCLGVSTFLSEYVRLLIQEAHFEHDGAIWNSGLASRLLLHQICEHVWGIELDGFTFWMARCGVLAAMMPLVQRVQELAQSQPYFNTKSQLPRLCLFRNDTLKLIVPDGDDSESTWERERIFQLRNPTKLQFDFIVTNPPYMIRKTGTFSAPDPEVYDWTILGSSFAVGSGTAVDAAPTARVAKAPKLRRGRKKAALETFHATEEGVSSAVDTGDEAAHGYNESDSEVATPESSASAGSGSILSARAEMSLSSLNTRSQPKGMMQAYGYFIWFAAQRLKPYTGVSCMITASQWLTLEFAAKLRAWLFENCLMDEFFQFEPFKVFSKVQTDSLIFKIRSLGSAHDDISVREKALQDHRTIFLRHTDHHKPLEGILQDYMNYRLEDVSGVTSGLDSSPDPNDLSLSIMVSYKTRQELSAAISAPPVSFLPASASMPSGGISKTNSSNEPTTATDTTTASATSATPIPTATWTYSFAPMMPSSGLTTYLLALTQDLGGICSPGTKKVNRLSAPEPLLWHRGPNTNPVYGLVTRMEFALANFGPAMAERWFKPALYWNGKNSPDEGSGGPGGGTPSSSKAMHKEGLFWHTRDRLRLSKKEGSPAESYVVPKPDPQRVYALCMVDKESVKVLKQQMQQGVHGSLALWDYLTDVRTHFQPGLATKKRKVASGGKQQDVNDDGVAFCSTNQCGSDVPEKIIHPINYGYFSKTQPRQRFFLDTHSLAVTNQCIYLTLNMISHHYDADQSPPLVYFLTLLNSSTLQFFVLHYCQYDQQGRMRLFRESMAKIPFQDRDVKLNPERTRYASRLGELMLELKGLLYNVVTQWQLTGSGGYHHHGYGHGYGHVGNTSSRRGSLPSMNISGRGTGIGRGNNRLYDSSLGPGGLSGTPGSSNHGLLDWVRRGGDAPTGVLIRTRDQIHRMLVSAAMTTAAETSQLDPGPAGRPATNNSPPVSQPFSMSSIARGVRSSGVVLTDTDSDTNTGTDTESDVDDHSVTQLHLGGDGGDIAGREYGLGSELDSPRRISKEVTDFGDLTAMAMDPPRRPHPLASSGSDASMAPIAAAHSSSSSSLPLAQLPPDTSDLSLECDKIMQAIERVVAMVEMVQWAVDQYGYMLYGIRPKFQKLLELELKIVYSSLVDSLIAPSSPITSAAVSERTLGPNPNEALPASRPQQPLHQPTSIEEDKQKPGVHLPQPQSQSRQVPGGGAASRLGITVFGLHRWDDCDTNAAADNSDQQQQQRSSIPVYGSTVFENARTAIDHLQRFLHRYPLA